MSFNVSPEKAIENAGRFLKEGGAHAVKLEGGVKVEEAVRAIVRAGIPVVGHIGLTPQTANMLGGYRVQGKTAAAARRILEDALLLEHAGVVMIVVECIPVELAKLVCERVKVPVVGIGSGPFCDGQVLVLNDMLGFAGEYAPKFVKRYARVGDAIGKAAAAFRDEVTRGVFPGPEHSFRMEGVEQRKLLGRSRARARRR
jgi:3-methyl-2-oxobutanoate hydroxymethyltransferase